MKEKSEEINQKEEMVENLIMQVRAKENEITQREQNLSLKMDEIINVHKMKESHVLLQIYYIIILVSKISRKI